MKNKPAPSDRTGFTHESTIGKSVEWYTPAWLLERLGLVYDLDVCSPGHGKSAVPARRHYTKADDGLTSPWHGVVWCNPPYGRETGAWLRRLAEHGDGIGLVFARTDTAWFHDAAATATLICFTRGRIAFINGATGLPANNTASGSVLIAYGRTAADALEQADLGLCVRPTAR